MISDLGTMLSRILTLAVKEVLTLFRDPKGRLVLIAPPIMQLFLSPTQQHLRLKMSIWRFIMKIPEFIAGISLTVFSAQPPLPISSF